MAKPFCISIYVDDLVRLDATVEKLKSKGVTRANRSAVIRQALDLTQAEVRALTTNEDLDS